MINFEQLQEILAERGKILPAVIETDTCTKMPEFSRQGIVSSIPINSGMHAGLMFNIFHLPKFYPDPEISGFDVDKSSQDVMISWTSPVPLLELHDLDIWRPEPKVLKAHTQPAYTNMHKHFGKNKR